MEDHELDGIMNEEAIVPSAGFVLSVMGAVRRDPVAPPGLEFPWAGALPAFAALVVLFVLCFVLLIHQAAVSQPGSTTLPSAILGVATTYDVGWIALALALTVVSVKLPLAFVRAKSSGSRHFLAV